MKHIGLADHKRHHLIVAISLFGEPTRGTIFGLMRVLLSYAAWRFHARGEEGLVAVLYALRRQAYGSWLLGVVAFGLMAYGIFQFAKARYRNI